MSHTFLSLDMNLIPQSTKDNVPTFWQGLFSNDKSRMLIDGYNEQGVLVHPQVTLNAWLQWSGSPQEIQEKLIGQAIQHSSIEFSALKSDINSIWYVKQEDLT